MEDAGLFRMRETPEMAKRERLTPVRTPEMAMRERRMREEDGASLYTSTFIQVAIYKDYKEAARIRDSLKSLEEQEPVLHLQALLKKAVEEERFQLPSWALITYATSYCFLPYYEVSQNSVNPSLPVYV
ncbi:hypothetical protein KSP40_PGU017263 [Platanthera guangdongensis]|uniref:Uncharacterized protein n=1 Tax=Platanthera guangdongensis TaxID=2320717 RepID=A0ABR2LQ93_9ASPA